MARDWTSSVSPVASKPAVDSLRLSHCTTTRPPVFTLSAVPVLLEIVGMPPAPESPSTTTGLAIVAGP